MTMTAELDIADALDLEHALAHGAAVQAALGSTLSLDARRAQALGELARMQTSLDLAGLTGSAITGPTESQTDPSTLPAARQLVLHAHVNATADDTSDEGPALDPVGCLEERQLLVLLDQVKDWCADSGTRVVIKPVIDLNTTIRVPGYAIPDRLREFVTLRDRTCVFPWCSRPARKCQVDHIVPFDHDAHERGEPQPGPTSSGNCAALCAWHHRLKTHGRWRYRMTAPGVFEWTSPHGHRYRRDHTGTTPIDEGPDDSSGGPPRP